ncbi:hypothetical protein [Ensifer sp. SL37]|uniref:hypothetical protein n=1 Tax=Ensifer sp. SL37 TaxID=2995137 RepID=UPI00227306CE|nr:hypothetical protein [Ensifer sp. SL37]MCY1740774.1 hypothetical protein [Ensifer sp. SL37]
MTIISPNPGINSFSGTTQLEMPTDAGGDGPTGKRLPPIAAKQNALVQPQVFQEALSNITAGTTQQLQPVRNQAAKPTAPSQSASESASTVGRAVSASSPVLFAIAKLNEAKIDPAGKASIKTGTDLKSHGYQAPRWQDQHAQVSNLQAAMAGKLGGLAPLEGAFRDHVDGFYGNTQRRSELNKAVPKRLAETARQDPALSKAGRDAVLGLASNDKSFVAVIPAINGYPAKNALFISERSNFTAKAPSKHGSDSVDAGGQPLGQRPGVLALFDAKGNVAYHELNNPEDAFNLLSDPQAARQLLPHFSQTAQSARTSSNQSRGVPDVFEAFEQGRKGELDSFAFGIETPKQASDAGSYLTGFGASYGPGALGDALADYNLLIAKEDGKALLASTTDLGLETFGDLLKQVNVAAAFTGPLQAVTPPPLEEVEIAAETAAVAEAAVQDVAPEAAAELEVGEDLATASNEATTVTGEDGSEPLTFTLRVTGNGEGAPSGSPPPLNSTTRLQRVNLNYSTITGEYLREPQGGYISNPSAESLFQRLENEYMPQSSTANILGTPTSDASEAAQSVPVRPHLLAQRIQQAIDSGGLPRALRSDAD